MFEGGAVTSEAGTVLWREAERAIGLIERVAACFTDHGEAEQVVDVLPTLIGQRIVVIGLGDEDINDDDAFRRDPVLALFSDELEAKRKDGAVLGGKSMINWLEHAPWEGGDRYDKIGDDPQALERVFVDAFLDAMVRRPSRSFSTSMPPMIRGTATRRAGSSMATTIVTASCRSMSLRPASLGGEAPALEHRRCGRRQGRGGVPRRRHPAALAEGTDRAAR